VTDSRGRRLRRGALLVRDVPFGKTLASHPPPEVLMRLIGVRLSPLGRARRTSIKVCGKPPPKVVSLTLNGT
jgi:hypothetical protein